MKLNTTSTLFATLCAGALLANVATSRWQTASGNIDSNVTNRSTIVTAPITACDYGGLSGGDISTAGTGQTIEYIFNISCFIYLLYV